MVSMPPRRTDWHITAKHCTTRHDDEMVDKFAISLMGRNGNLSTHSSFYFILCVEDHIMHCMPIAMVCVYYVAIIKKRFPIFCILNSAVFYCDFILNQRTVINSLDRILFSH